MPDEPLQRTRKQAGRSEPVTRRTYDAASFEPAYMRIANALSGQIASGIYRAGDQLPTEPQLRAEYGVSPVTVRRAITLLLDRGLVTTTKGKGTFVRSLGMGEAIFRLQELTDLWADDASVEVNLLEARIVLAEQDVAAKLELKEDALVVLLRRVILRGGVPIVYQVEYVTYDEHRPLVEAQLQVTSLEGLLISPRAEGVLSGQITIQAISLEEEAAAALHLPLESAAFTLEALFFDYDGRPLSWGRFFCRADQFKLTTRVGPMPQRSES